MVETERTTNQDNQNKKLMTFGHLVVLPAIVVVCLAAAYVVFTGAQEGETSPANTQSAAQTQAITGRKWAERLEVPGVPNFHKVSDGLYRGAQPTAEGMRQLEKLGIKTVVSLRSFHSDRDELAGTGLAYEHIFMKTWHPETEEVIRFLQIVTDESRTPVFVHCQRGADRTGTMCAIYRIAVQGWGKQEAIEEMTKGGFGFYEGWQNLINYINNLDFNEIKISAGLK